MNFKVCVCHAVNAFGVILITRSGILCQQSERAFTKVLGNLFEQLVGNADVNGALSRLEAEAADGIGMGVRVGKVGLDI